MSLIDKIKRPALAFALVLGVAGAAAANDFCAPCVQPDYCTPACTTTEPAPAMEATCTAFCGDPALATTTLPGWYSTDYDYSVSARRDTGISYLIPTMNGFIESDRIPLTNPVDQYYATHEVRNGQVVQTGRITENGELASLY